MSTDLESETDVMRSQDGKLVEVANAGDYLSGKETAGIGSRKVGICERWESFPF